MVMIRTMHMTMEQMTIIKTTSADKHYDDDDDDDDAVDNAEGPDDNCAGCDGFSISVRLLLAE